MRALLLLSFLFSALRSCAKLIPLKALQCPGTLQAGGRVFDAAFFCRAAGLEVIGDESSDETDSVVRLCDVLALPLHESKAGKGVLNNIFTNSLLNRDGGIFDKLPYAGWFPAKPLAKKSFYDDCLSLQLAQQSMPPEAAFLRSLNSTLGLCITGLLIEVADEISEKSVSLGCAALISRTAFVDEWSLGTGDAEATLRRLQQQQGSIEAADRTIQLS